MKMGIELESYLQRSNTPHVCSYYNRYLVAGVFLLPSTIIPLVLSTNKTQTRGIKYSWFYSCLPCAPFRFMKETNLSHPTYDFVFWCCFVRCLPQHCDPFRFICIHKFHTWITSWLKLSKNLMASCNQMQ